MTNNHTLLNKRIVTNTSKPNNMNMKQNNNENKYKEPSKLIISQYLHRNKKTLISTTNPYLSNCQDHDNGRNNKMSSMTISDKEKKEDKLLLTPPSSPDTASCIPESYHFHYKKKVNSTFEYNNRILQAKRNGHIRIVMNEFSSMKKNKVKLTQHTYNLVLEAHAILRREGTPLTTMLKVYNEMIHANIQPNTYTYIIMIRTLCKRDVEVQKTVAMLKRQSMRIGEENEDIRILESERNLERALAIFRYATADGISINTFEIETFNQLLRVLSHYGNTVDATFVYHQLQQPTVKAKPNSATYAALINLFGRAGDIDTSLYYYNVYTQVKDSLGSHDSSYIYNALVDCHLKCGLLEGALHIIEHEMIEKNIKITCIPYNSIIRHYCTHNQMEEAEALIDRLIQEHQRDPTKYPCPDASSYGPLLAVYCQVNQWEEATRIYDALIKTDISKAYGNLANYALLCLSHHDRQRALSIISDMRGAHLEPDPILACRIITAFSQAEEINEAIEALSILQQTMSPRALTKGFHHLMEASLSIVLHCACVRQVLQVLHTILPTLIKNNQDILNNHISHSFPTPYDIMCKTLLDSYFDMDSPRDIQYTFTTADFQLIFDAAFIVCVHNEMNPSTTLSHVLLRLLQDMHTLGLNISNELFNHVLDQIRARGDLEAEAKWISAFSNMEVSSSTSAMDKSVAVAVVVERRYSLSTKTSEQDDDDDEEEEEEEEDDIDDDNGIDIILKIDNKENDYCSNTTTMALSSTDNTAEVVSQRILKAVMNRHYAEAIHIFEDCIICQGLIPTPEIMRDVITLAGKQGHPQTSLTLYHNSIYAFKDIRDTQTREKAIYMATNSLLIVYAQMGDMEKAKVYYDRIKVMGYHPDSDGYASLLLGSAKSATDEATDALAIYDEAKRHHVKPTTFFYNVIISKLAKARRLDTALTLFEEMRHLKVPANSITYGAIISASVRSGSRGQSHRLFEEMLSSPSYQPRVGPFNNMMQLYVRQHPNRERVLEYFAEMRRRHIKPSPHSYKLLMEAYTHIPPYDMLTAHKLLSDMRRRDHLRPQATHYATLIYSYGILQRDVQSAERVYAEMIKAGIHPDEGVYQAMIDTFISNNDLEKAENLYYEEMKKDTRLQKMGSGGGGGGGSPYIENLFIRGYGERGQLEKVEALFEAMSDDKTQQHLFVIREPSTYEAMIRAYVENNKVDKAKEIFDLMVKRDFPPKVISAVAELVPE